MSHDRRPVLLVPAFSFLLATALVAAASVGTDSAALLSFSNPSGVLRTVSSSPVDANHPFFQPLGKAQATTCEHCHFASDAWSVSAEHARELFDSTGGQHPLFTAPTANDFRAARALGAEGTLAERRAAYSLMLDKGAALVRRNLNVTPALDYAVTAVVDPSLPSSLHTIAVDEDGHVVANGTPGSTPAIPGADYLAYTAQDNGGVAQIWVHRRPLPTANFQFLTAVAWDGQDTRQSPNPVLRPSHAGVFDVSRATIRGRATGPSLIAPDGHVYTGAELDALATQLTDFMFSLTVAQDSVRGVGSLRAGGARGGVAQLAKQPFHFGTNDVLQGDLTVEPDGTVLLTGTPFSPVVFDLFDAWRRDPNPRRASIARGQALFNSERLVIGDVGGLNDSTIALPDGSSVQGPATAFMGSCGTCHDSPNVGNHSTRLPIDIGVSDKAPVALGRDAVRDLPLFILTRNSDGRVAQTTDPGRAVITGKFAHIGQFKGPILHGMAARPPFFHNGMAETLEDVVEFYDERFDASFTRQEKADLVAFLESL